ncbi:MAG: Mrp/NBP35 family ATP-binding protein [Mogibacterium sp.]|nr:Mrp/NBP35 family ATP-binding protein [Mogibacterium sp.]
MAEYEEYNKYGEVPEDCTHDCSTCSANCSSRSDGPVDFSKPLNGASSVKKVIAVVSGKGGVGKSMVTALSAVAANRQGYKVGILDADITGPSIPKMFGLHGLADVNEIGIFPMSTPTETEIMSLNLLVDDESAPVVWRGPVIAGAVTQFWTDVIWGDLDVMFIDMPPGTGDVPLTVFQSIQVDGIIIVTSPQELVTMIVQKAMNMANLMNIPILGIVENMSYLECPDCGRKIEIFGKSKVDTVAVGYGIPVLAKLPIDPKLAELADAGRIEFTSSDLMEGPILELLKDVEPTVYEA